jgi:hypothetical protein
MKSKAILIGIAVALILLILIWIVGKNYGKIKASGVEDVVEKAKKDIQKNKLSFDPSWYESAADTIFRAMNGTGTDEDAIYRIFKLLNNKDDLLQLIISFGARESKTWYSRFKGSLTEWIQDELDESEAKRLNKILTEKNIQYQF